MTLTVLQVAFPFARVGAATAGGAEQVLGWLDAALVSAGHCSVVVAADGSTPAGTLVATALPEGRIDDAMRIRVRAEHRRNVERAVEQYRPDVVHFHGIDFHTYLPDAGAPALVTLHLPPAWYPAEVFQPARPDTWLHCVSHAQRRASTASDRLLPTVENGVPPAPAWASRVHRRDYALFVGRICPEKNVAAAIDAAERAGVPLVIAGQVFPYAEHEAYFREQVAPRLNRDVRFVGPVGPRAKTRLLAGARCLLVPSVAPETSSLVAMEAAACGTPVVAFASGALPEIVEHGVSGLIVRDVDAMAAGIADAHRIGAEACREVAARRFSLAGMVERYVQAYRRIARTDRLAGERARRCLPPNGGHARRLNENPQYQASMVTDANALDALAGEWHALWSAAPDLPPFAAPQWLLPWWRHVGQGGLLSVVVRRAGRLVGLLPLYVYEQQDGRRELFPLGIATTDYLDATIAAGEEEAVMDAALSKLAEHADRWDAAEWPQLRPGSPLLAGRMTATFVDQTSGGDVCPVLPLDGGDWRRHVPKTLQQNLGYYARRAAKAGTLAVAAATHDTVPGAHAALLRLHAARWQSRGEAGVLADHAVQRWHAETMRGLLALGLLRLYTMTLDGNTIAACYVVHDRPGPDARAYYYLGGFDPAYRAFSPGTLLIGHAVERAAAEGMTAFDFLRGREPYKYLWGAQDRPTLRRRITREGAAS